jgi:NAD(P)-dependent dehydrogenase (short-subunit alcohol dehydrogenase family)
MPDPSRSTTAPTDDRSLGGRVALITGVGPGIGRACAAALAEDGADVVIAARDADRLETIADELRPSGRRIVAVPTDITVPDQVARLVGTAIGELGRLDAVVNVAARAARPSFVEDFDPDEYRESFEVNVLATLDVTRRAIPHLRAAGGGSIVQISALSAHTRLAGLADYTSTKAALETASLTLAREVGRDGIRVNVVVPGYTSGDGLDGHIATVAERRGVTSDVIERELQRSSALRRFVDPDDIAEAVRFLASGRSRAITGQLLHVNAGEWLP